MSKAIFSILSILALLLSGINCATGKRSGGVGDAPPSTPDRADVLKTAIDVLRGTGYEIKDKKHDIYHSQVRATNGNSNVTLVIMQSDQCLVRWNIRNPTYKYSTTNKCDDFRSELERHLRQSLK